MVECTLTGLSFIQPKVQRYLQSPAMPIKEIEGTLRFGILDFGKAA
jgi:hypothetical protein